MPLLCAVDITPARSSFSSPVSSSHSTGRRLPPLNALRAFEACARLGSDRRLRRGARRDARGDQQAGGAPRALGGRTALRERWRAARADLRGGALRGGARLGARPRGAEHGGSPGDRHRPAAAGPAHHHRVGGLPLARPAPRGVPGRQPRSGGLGEREQGAHSARPARWTRARPPARARAVGGGPCRAADDRRGGGGLGSLGRRPAQDSGGPGAGHAAPRRGSPPVLAGVARGRGARPPRLGPPGSAARRRGARCSRPPVQGRGSPSAGSASRPPSHVPVRWSSRSRRASRSVRATGSSCRPRARPQPRKRRRWPAWLRETAGGEEAGVS